MDKIVLLKKFGTVVINKKVKGHKLNADLWHVYFAGGWHTVPVEDVEEL